MNWLKEQEQQTRAFIRGEFYSSLWMSAVAYLVLMVLGFVLGLLFKELAANFVLYFSQQISSAGILQQDGSINIAPLLINNIRAALLTVAYGFIPFIFLPAISLGMNSILLGLFAAYYLNNGMSMLYYFAAIVPHGIFEIPALVIAIALGLFLCGRINDFVRHNTKGVMLPAMKNILRVFLLRVVPLLLVASLIEAYITPWILTLI